MNELVSARPVAAADRVSDVLARDEALVDVFVRFAPHFSKLRNRGIRRVMARLVTVEQAAKTANVPTERLIEALNAALGIQGEAAVGRPTPVNEATPESGARTHPVEARVVEVDVREELRQGQEPFARIMHAVRDLEENDVLLLRTTFEPAPLVAVLAARGFVHESRASGADDWSTWFWRSGENDQQTTDVAAPEVRTDSAPLPASPAKGGSPEGEPTVLLDVRGLQPPEPMMRTLAALETLPPGHVLVHVNSRVPQLLFPMLAERGFACDVDESQADAVFVRIWRRG